MKIKLSTLILFLTLTSSFTFGAAINASDWEITPDSGITIQNGEMLFSKSGAQVLLKNSESYSTKGTLSLSYEIPSFYLIPQADKFGNAYLDMNLNGSNLNSFSCSIITQYGHSRINPYATINDENFISTNVLDTIDNGVIDITYKFEYVKENEYILSIESGNYPEMNISGTYNGTLPETFSGFLLSPFDFIDSLASNPIKVTDFSYTAAVPEPATYAVILGTLALGIAACRKRK